jgi:putative endonuclease
MPIPSTREGRGFRNIGCMYFVYIIQSEIDNSLYIGFSKDVFERLKGHNSGKTAYTKRKMPWKLVYFEQFENKTDALKREKFLKSQKNRDFYENLIKTMVR